MMASRLKSKAISPTMYVDERTFHSAKSGWSPCTSAASFLTRRMDVARNLYRKDLYAHYGCVNAIEFSKEGELLVSGGDDRRVLLWKVEEAISGQKQPRAMKGEHMSNIFCLSFDPHNEKIFSAGNDDQVIVHDLKTGEILDLFPHEAAVYGVSVSPASESIFTSAGEDGQVLLYDIRAPPSTDPMCLARYHDAFHAVQFHPIEPMYVVTANSREGVALWDIRKPRVPVLRYGEKHCAQSSMCARFNRTGSQIIALRRRLPPVLYDTHHSKAVCQFDADHYYNSCTMKSCCFAGDSDQFVLSGSDDFNLYMWKIPGQNSGVSFVPEAHIVLRGHRSIVNQVRFNPKNFIVASSGVEKIVKLWSAVELPGSSGGLAGSVTNSDMTRRVYTHDEYITLVLEIGQNVSHDYSHGSTEEDPRMMAFFDSLVQREVEGWTSNTDLSDDPDDLGIPQPGTSQDQDDEDETTQSSSSLATSQSDDNHSLEDEPDPSQLQSRPVDLLVRRRRWMLRCDDQPDENEDNDEDEGKEGEGTGGSDWILHLIARKRAQLKAAKKARRERRQLQKQKRKSQHALLSFSSPRRYLYQPEGRRGEGEIPSVSSSYASVITRDGASSSSTNCSRMSMGRQYVAPYTIMVMNEQNNGLDSEDDDDDDEDDEDEGGEFLTARENCESETSNSHTRKRLWTSESDISSDSDSDVPPRRRKRAIHGNSQKGDGERDECRKSKKIHFISEVVDSESSETELGPDTREVASAESSNLQNQHSLTDRLDDNNISAPELSVNDNGIDSITNGDLDIAGSLGDIEPISSISMDENGSLLFDSNHTSLMSSLELQNSLEINLPATPVNKVRENGTEITTNGSASSVTPDSGIKVTPSSSERSDDEQCSSVSSVNGSLGTATENGGGSNTSYSFKKRVPSCGLRYYRTHSNEDL
ncbi:uncharacterized protein LOC143038430 [Oratosquilla oratoria]|uniref:uncharacterized protein LOC143038430 n=1 Tax=Oratosquilla oratoria TaxID=337810 RepID=UPI003F7776C4